MATMATDYGFDHTNWEQFAHFYWSGLVTASVNGTPLQNVGMVAAAVFGYAKEAYDIFKDLRDHGQLQPGRLGNSVMDLAVDVQGLLAGNLLSNNGAPAALAAGAEFLRQSGGFPPIPTGVLTTQVYPGGGSLEELPELVPDYDPELEEENERDGEPEVLLEEPSEEVAWGIWTGG